MAKYHVTTSVNGEPTEFLCSGEQTLLDVLRDELELTGTKEGCATGDCGACSVTVDGTLVCACLMLGTEAEGREIGTIEGMADGDTLHPCSASSWRTRRCSAASARRDSWSRPRRCSTRTRSLPRPRRATGSPATSAAAPATTRSSAP